MEPLKLSPCNEEKHDLDAYLSRFEPACQAFNIQSEHWSTQLARLLQGQSLHKHARTGLAIIWPTELTNATPVIDNADAASRVTRWSLTRPIAALKTRRHCSL